MPRLLTRVPNWRLTCGNNNHYVLGTALSLRWVLLDACRSVWIRKFKMSYAWLSSRLASFPWSSPCGHRLDIIVTYNMNVFLGISVETRANIVIASRCSLLLKAINPIGPVINATAAIIICRTAASARRGRKARHSTRHWLRGRYISSYVFHS